ncbi:MAG: alpha/beta hydrolase [Betaproteobacteria bacterium]|nr:alpha/beta hydrolase [Betaproteobacteria bacterium]
MAVIPLRLGEPPRQLFAMLQPAGGAAPRQHGVLLCNPFGQEAIRAHRLVRVLGDRLAAAGFAVMRFDYYGTGDSGGDDTEGRLPRWIDDIVAVDAVLRSRSGISRTTWIGIRLGASLAVAAAARARPHPERLILWDPITDGAAYLEELASAHASSIRAGSAGLATARRHSRYRTHPPGPDDEALGFPLGESLRADIRDISARSFAQCPSPMTVISSADASPCCRVPTQVERSARVHRIASELEWVAISQMRSAVVPSDALQAVNDALGAGP